MTILLNILNEPGWGSDLLDLSNTYFEGRYTLSDLLARGRSKEKRTDCKQVVFGAVVNTDGLLVRTDIFEGNAADYKCMQPMIDALKDGTDKENLIIVMDAGMSGVENIKWLKDNHYKYIPDFVTFLLRPNTFLDNQALARIFR